MALQLSRKLWKNVIVCCLQTLMLTDFTLTLAQTQVVRNTQRGNVIMFVLIYLHKIKFYGFMVMTNIYLTATLDLTSLLFSQILQVIQLQFGMLIFSYGSIAFIIFDYENGKKECVRNEACIPHKIKMYIVLLRITCRVYFAISICLSV